MANVGIVNETANNTERYNNDEYDKWKTIRNRWVDNYRNREDIPGECVKSYVTEKDEWCAEAYMETDYSELSQDIFENVVKDYFTFKSINNL